MSRDWRDYAACQDMDPEMWYPMKGDAVTEGQALAICVRCPVTAECLANALEGAIVYGIWGGTTEAVRRPMISSGSTKPAPIADGVKCPRCHKVRAKGDFIGVDDVPNVRCNHCRERQRRWDNQRRKEGVR